MANIDIPARCQRVRVTFGLSAAEMQSIKILDVPGTGDSRARAMSWTYRRSQTFRSVLEKDNEAPLCPRVLRCRFDVVERDCGNHGFDNLKELQEQRLRAIELHDDDHHLERVRAGKPETAQRGGRSAVPGREGSAH